MKKGNSSEKLDRHDGDFSEVEDAINEVDTQADLGEKGAGFDIPFGSFDERIDVDTDKKEDDEVGLSLTFVINSIAALVSLFLFANMEDLCLSTKEVDYYTDMERRCGVKFNINSPVFYFSMIVIAYGHCAYNSISKKRKEKQIGHTSEG